MDAELRIFDLHPLFEMVQMQQIFADGKTFVDAIPTKSLQGINELFLAIKDKPGFSLEAFVEEHFQKPITPNTGYQTGDEKNIEQHINDLWPVLTRQPDKGSSTLLPLPYPYIVPGGRFGEIYYWDSYFTMLGLQAAGRTDLIESMIKNFAYLIDTIGYIPNGNRQYYIGRSQPPFFSLMVTLLASIKGDRIVLEYLPQLEKEYAFWMDGSKMVSVGKPYRRCAALDDVVILNRYYDDNDTPRPESYREDVHLAADADNKNEMYRHIRAAAESGWDFSSRWCKDPYDFKTIHTTDIIPVDLNCLLYHHEIVLQKAYTLQGDKEKAAAHNNIANKRKAAIQKYFWNESKGFYVDYDWKAGSTCDVIAASGLFPLFFKIADKTQIPPIITCLQAQLLAPGGICATPYPTGQQWDAPNGWAPLQWIAIQGLRNYEQTELANDIANRWIQLNTEVFKRTGSLMEKYNVVDTHLEAGGGEYPGQDGFGWTNGVLLALLKTL